MEPRKRLALSQGPALPGFSQTPRSPQHTSHIKRKQVTQMRQLVLVCDDSCDSFFFSPPGFPLVSPLMVFAGIVQHEHPNRDAGLHIRIC